MHKLGIDYDQINATQGNNNAFQASIIFNQMEAWDNELQLSMTQGVEYGNTAANFGELSGNASDLIGG